MRDCDRQSCDRDDASRKTKSDLLKRLHHYQELDCTFQPISQYNSKGKHEQRAKNCEIEREMGGKIPVLTGVTETAARDVEAASFCGNCNDKEDRDQPG